MAIVTYSNDALPLPRDGWHMPKEVNINSKVHQLNMSIGHVVSCRLQLTGRQNPAQA
jgi:hypothetical protein